MSPSLVRRRLQAHLLNALGDTPVTCLGGASLTGKHGLVQALQTDLPEAVCLNLADPATRAEATQAPAAFLEGLPALAFLEQVDQAPVLLPLLKPALAAGRRLLLTTSRRLPGLAESLSSDLETFTLWPLAQAEREGTLPGLIDACFQGEPLRLQLAPSTRQELLARVLAGGFPQVAALTPAQRGTWFHAYLTALVHGRLRDLTDLREVHHLTRLVTFPDADPDLARRTRELLEDCHVMASLASGPGTRPRWFLDSALQAHLLGMAPEALSTQPALAAPLLATFAVMELIKTAPWSGSRPTLAHLKAGGQDLIVLEDHRRQLVAITVSAAATLQPEAFQGLQALRDKVGDRLRTGLVLHAGGTPRAAGPGFWSLPFEALWAARA